MHCAYELMYVQQGIEEEGSSLVQLCFTYIAC